MAFPSLARAQRTLATAVLTAVGSPSADYIPQELLPPIESDQKPRKHRKSGSGTTIAGAMLDSLDTNKETKGEKWYGSYGEGGISAKMLHNVHVKESVGYVTSPLRAATWRFKEASSDGRDREVAGFAGHAFLERLPFDLVLERMVGGAWVDGFAMSEMLDDMRPVSRDRFPHHPRPDAALVPTEFAEIPANTVARWYQRKGAPTQLEAIGQWQPYSDSETPGLRRIDADRIIRLTLGQKGANFAGIAGLRPSYGPWKLLHAFETWRAIGFERTAVGTPVCIAPDGQFDQDEADDIELVLENMRTMAKGSIVLPGGYTLEWSGAGENDIVNISIAIEACKTDIAINASAGFTRLGLVGPGSYALANTQAGQYHLSTVGHAKNFALVINLGLDGWSPLQRIVESNYGVGTPLPLLEARNLPTKDIKTILTLLNNGVASKVITPDAPLEEEYRAMIQVGPHDPSTARKPAAPMPFAPKPEPEDEDREEEEDEEAEEEKDMAA